MSVFHACHVYADYDNIFSCPAISCAKMSSCNFTSSIFSAPRSQRIERMIQVLCDDRRSYTAAKRAHHFNSAINVSRHCSFDSQSQL